MSKAKTVLVGVVVFLAGFAVSNIAGGSESDDPTYTGDNSTMSTTSDDAQDEIDAIAEELRDSADPDEADEVEEFVGAVEEALKLEEQISEIEAQSGADNWTPLAQSACEFVSDLRGQRTLWGIDDLQKTAEDLEDLMSKAQAEDNEPLYWHLNRVRSTWENEGDGYIDTIADFQDWCRHVESQYESVNPTTTTTTQPTTTTTMGACPTTEDIQLSPEQPEIELTVQPDCWSGWITVLSGYDSHFYVKSGVVDIEFSRNADGEDLGARKGWDLTIEEAWDVGAFRVRSSTPSTTSEVVITLVER